MWYYTYIIYTGIHGLVLCSIIIINNYSDFECLFLHFMKCIIRISEFCVNAQKVLTFHLIYSKIGQCMYNHGLQNCIKNYYYDMCVLHII